MNATALITGASSGFGEALARRFANEGWRLVLVARRFGRLQRLQEELGGPAKVHIIELDVRDRAAVVAKLGERPAPFLDVSLLVNNAGLALGLEPAWQADPDDWDTMVDTNIKGLLYVTRAILPGMVKRNRGHVVNLGSIAGSWPHPGAHVYGASKAFVQQFSRNLRADLIGTRIRVTNIEPGLCETEFSFVHFKGDRAKAEELYRGNDPLVPEDIAEIINWVVKMPSQVNINSIEVMPITQTWGALPVKPVRAPSGGKP
ncbi:SDR family oxidoreductase [Nitrococcus mobilis]|uniref:SDR family oxidoreductase n=1 Tax=Nitrococcus mobilis TaxID=35797 RepID=UPI0003140CCF|nr:SDR family oxidoreductase [Nitrococcus mobilis]